MTKHPGSLLLALRWSWNEHLQCWFCCHCWCCFYHNNNHSSSINNNNNIVRWNLHSVAIYTPRHKLFQWHFNIATEQHLNHAQQCAATWCEGIAQLLILINLNVLSSSSSSSSSRSSDGNAIKSLWCRWQCVAGPPGYRRACRLWDVLLFLVCVWTEAVNHKREQTTRAWRKPSEPGSRQWVDRENLQNLALDNDRMEKTFRTWL